MDHILLPLSLSPTLPLRTPKRRLKATPVQGTTTEGIPSSPSSSTAIVQDSPLSAFALAPRRNFAQELETRTLYIRPIGQMTSRKLELPPLASSNNRAMSEEETIPTFSLKMKRQRRDQEHQHQ